MVELGVPAARALGACLQLAMLFLPSLSAGATAAFAVSSLACGNCTSLNSNMGSGMSRAYVWPPALLLKSGQAHVFSFRTCLQRKLGSMSAGVHVTTTHESILLRAMSTNLHAKTVHANSAKARLPSARPSRSRPSRGLAVRMSRMLVPLDMHTIYQVLRTFLMKASFPTPRLTNT